MAQDLGQEAQQLQKRLSEVKERAQRVSSLMEHPGYKDLAKFLESLVLQMVVEPDGSDWPFRRAFHDGKNATALEVLNWFGTMRKVADRAASDDEIENLVR